MKPAGLPSGEEHELPPPVTCSKCGRLFIATPEVEGEKECFTCAPRSTKSDSVEQLLPLKIRSRRRRKFSMEKNDGVQNIQHGGVVLVLGVFVTFATYAFAPNFGGYFLVAWGSIVFGALRLLYGITQYFS